MSEVKKLAYICSSGHSGSTLLSIILGNCAGLASLGEISQTVKRMHSQVKPCTCGMAPCPVWGPILKQVDGLPAQDEERRHLTAVQALVDSMPDKLVVDSSKTLAALKLIRERLKYDVYVIHLLRDGRAVAWSNWKKDRDIFEAATSWQKGNAGIEKYLSHMPADRHMRVRYEDLVVEPEAVLRRVLAFLGQDASGLSVSLNASRQHHLRGNRMRFDAQEIVTDTSYVSSIDTQTWAALNHKIGKQLAKYGYAPDKEKMLAMLSQDADVSQ